MATSRRPDRGVVGLLLAAGSGTRFARASGGRPGSKLLAVTHGTRRVIDGAIAALAPNCDRVIAAVARGSAVERALATRPDLTLTSVGNPERGMGTSLAAAVRFAEARHQPRFLVVMLADMPYVRPSTVAKLVERALASEDPSCIVAPTWQGRRGHPVVFGAAHLPELARLDGDRGAQALLQHQCVTAVAVDDPAVVHDVDEPTDLAEPTRDA